MVCRLLWISLVGAVFFLGFPLNSYAHIDPGAGSSVAQVVIAFLVVGLFFAKSILNKIKAFFFEVISGKSKPGHDNAQ